MDKSLPCYSILYLQYIRCEPTEEDSITHTIIAYNIHATWFCMTPECVKFNLKHFKAYVLARFLRGYFNLNFLRNRGYCVLNSSLPNDFITHDVVASGARSSFFTSAFFPMKQKQEGIWNISRTLGLHSRMLRLVSRQSVDVIFRHRFLL